MLNIYVEKKQFFLGAILFSIAHAIMMTSYPELSYEISWDNDNFNFNDSSTVRGTITFKNDSFFCAIQDISCKSNRVDKILESVPNSLKNIAMNETMEYLTLKNERGLCEKVATTAMWGIDKEIKIFNDRFEDFLNNGGYFIGALFESLDKQIEYLVNYYEMNELQVKLMLDIYNLRINNSKLILERKYKDILESMGDIEESIVSFEEIGVKFL